MAGLIKGIAALPKRYAQVLMAKISALIILFAILILLTILLAYLMLVEWHCSQLTTLLVCFGPWLVLLLVAVILALVNTAKLEQEKQDLYELGRQQILIQGLTLLTTWLKRRKKKTEVKEVDNNDEQ